jgi:hypothetical protein
VHPDTILLEVPDTSQVPIKDCLILLSIDVVTSWWFANSLLMLFRPDRGKYLPWWPQLRETPETPETVVMPRRLIRRLGFVFAVASGIFLFRVLAPVTVRLFLFLLRR